MFAHEFSHDLVLLLDLGFQGLDLAGLGAGLARVGGAGFKGEGTVLEEFFLPEVEEGRLDLMLLADIGDRPLVEKVFAKNAQLLGPGKVTSFCTHRKLLHMARSMDLITPMTRILQFGLRQYNCTITGTAAKYSGGVGWDVESGGSLTITDSTICGNTAEQGYGGGVGTDGGKIDGNIIDDNSGGDVAHLVWVSVAK